MKCILVIAMLCLLTPNLLATAQTPPFDSTAIDRYIEREMEADRIPGLALAIVHQRQVVYVQGYGSSGDQPITPDTSFLLGSMSKSFTALAIMQLVEQNLIDLNAPVSEYLPWFSIQGNTDRITVLQLLHHTSSIPENAPRAQSDDQSLQAQIRALSNVTPENEPGTRFEYSSPNYLILGGIVEAVSGQTFGEYVQTNIFNPLDMRHSFTSLTAARSQGQMSSGHQYWFGFPVISNLPEEPGRLPTAALISSVSDLSRYLIMQSEGGQWNDTRLLSPEGVRQMHTADRPTSIYGMGWRASEIYGVPAVHHGGILPDFRGKMVMLPAQGWGVVVLTNTSSFWGEASSHRIADSVAGMLIGQSPQVADRPLSQLYLFIGAGALVIMLSQIWQLIRIPVWRAKQERLTSKDHSKSLVALLSNVAFTIGILVGLPLIVRMDWSTLIMQMPDIAYWTFAVCGLALIAGIIKLGLLFSLMRRTGQPI